MSIRRMPRQSGLAVICNGTARSSDVPNCTLGENGKPMKFITGVIRFDYTRKWLFAHEGWGRGLREDYKRNDLCPYHYKLERFLKYQRQWRRVEDRAKKEERRKAEAAANPKPKKPRKKKASTALAVGAVTEAEEANMGRPPPSSPSAASAPAPPT